VLPIPCNNGAPRATRGLPKRAQGARRHTGSVRHHHWIGRVSARPHVAYAPGVPSRAPLGSCSTNGAGTRSWPERCAASVDATGSSPLEDGSAALSVISVPVAARVLQPVCPRFILTVMAWLDRFPLRWPLAAFLGLCSLILVSPLQADGIEVCGSVPVYEPCEISFEMTAEEAAAHPNPYLSVDLRGEFRSPKAGATTLLSGFWDGGRRFKLRFTPRDEGRWDFRIRSNLKSVDGVIKSFQAAAPRTKGFIRVFNLRYFRYDERGHAHFWMGDTCYPLLSLPEDTFRAYVDARAAQKFNHMRGWILGGEQNARQALADPDRPDPAYFRQVDRRIAYLNEKGFFFDLIFASSPELWVELLPKPKQRERFVRYLVARYASRRITWQGLGRYEEFEQGRALLQEIARYLREFDFYEHPKSTDTALTSGPLFIDEWMDYVTHSSWDPNVAAVEYEVHPAPHVNVEFGVETSARSPGDDRLVDHHEYRRRLWNAAVHGQYVTMNNAATYGAVGAAVDPRSVESPGAHYMTVLHDFFAQTRYWDLQPHYRVRGGSGLALEVIFGRREEPDGIEYIVYLPEPKPVELRVRKDKYEVSWLNPIDGTWVHEKDKFKGELFTAGGPPNSDHDWVLYVRREGKKKSMNKSYILESRRAAPKKVLTAAADVPYEIQLPESFELTAGQEYEFNATITKDSRVVRQMKWVWTAEVAGSPAGPRVLGTSQFGRFRIPLGLTSDYPSPLQVRLLGVDGIGRVYEAFKPYELLGPEAAAQ